MTEVPYMESDMPAETELRQAHRRDRAALAVIAGEPELFVGSFTEGIVRRPADRTHRGMSVGRDTINVIPAGTR